MLFFIKNHSFSSRRRIALGLLTILLLFSCISVSADGTRSASPNTDPDHFSSSAPENLSAGMLYATSAIAIDASSGRTLFAKAADREIYPASTTKVLTALLAIENLPMDEVVTVSKNCMVGESSIYLEEGEKITVEDLLYGLLLKSGNDAAVALAEAVSGSVSDFCQLMNERAEELGCTNSHFNNANGLPDSEHYTTAQDYSKIVLEASRYDEFIKIVSTYKYELSIEKPDGETRTYTVKNTNALLPEAEGDYGYEYIIGGKTGYTDAAQHAFVSICEKDSRRIVTVVFGSTKEGKWYDTMHLADYCFAAYDLMPFEEIYAQNPLSVEVTGVAAEDDGILPLQVSNEGIQQLSAILLSNEELEAVRSNLSLYIRTEYNRDPFTAPIQQGTEVGTLYFSIGEMEEVAVPLLASRTVATAIADSTSPQSTQAPSSITDSGLKITTVAVSEGGWSNLYLLVIIPFVLFIILLVWLIAEVRRAKEEKRLRKKEERTADVMHRRSARTFDRHNQEMEKQRQGRPGSYPVSRQTTQSVQRRNEPQPIQHRSDTQPVRHRNDPFDTPALTPRNTDSRYKGR